MRRLELTVLAAILLSQTTVADAAARYRLSLPGGRLGDAVIALGRQSGISIGLSDPALAGQRVEAVRGSLTVRQALARLLRGTGARYVAVDSTTYRIIRAPNAAPRRLRAPRPAPARAPAPPPPQTEITEIVVTATKRPIRLAYYPGPINLVDGMDPVLRDALRGTDALVSRLPAVNSTHLGAGRNKLFLRGIADSSFNGPTQATVGQYFGETRLNYNAPDPDLRLYDIDRVEVLAGPQGTLYGAGSLGGIIRVVPNAPEPGELAASVSLGGSATAHGDPGADAAAMVNLPLGDRAGLRLVGYGASEGGYIDDPRRGLDDVNRTRNFGGRAALRAELGEWTVDAGAAGQRIEGEDGQFAERDAPPLTRRSAVAQPFSNDYFLGSLVVTREWGDLRLVSATGIVRQVLDERYDSTPQGGPPTVFDQENRITLLSSETRLSRQGPEGSGWLVGASFIRNESEQSRALGPPEAPVPITGVRNAVSEATLYGEASFSLMPGITATAGGRLTHSRLSGAALDVPAAILMALRGVQASRSETAILPSFGITGQAAPDLTLFLRYQEGFRPGGLAVAGPIIQRFRNDRVRTLEAGLRYGRPGASPFDAAASVAYTRWTDVQADIVDLAGFPTTANVGDGRVYTLDLRVGWRPLPGLSVEAAGIFNDSQITNPAPSIIITPTSPLPNVARFNGRIGADYHAAVGDGLDLRLSAAARYAGRSRLGIGPVLGEPQGDWLDVSLGARLESERHAFTLGVTNLLDAAGNRFALGSPFTLVEQRQITPLRPRTVRLGWEVRF